MSTALLETTAPPAVLDLTGDACSSPPPYPPPRPPRPPPHPLADGGQCDEPPVKRQRSDDGPGHGGPGSLAACVREQILPHVAQAVEGLPRDRYRIDDMAVQVRDRRRGHLPGVRGGEEDLLTGACQAVATLARSTVFRVAADEARGAPSALTKAEAAIATSRVVNALARLPVRTVAWPEAKKRLADDPRRAAVSALCRQET